MVDIVGIETFAEDLDDFASALDEIADDIDPAVDRGVRETALQIERTASRFAPVETGELRADIMAYRLRQTAWSIGTTKEYGPDVEYGTAPHTITPDTEDFLHFQVDGQWVTTDEVEHPGTEAQPFLRRALNTHRSDLVENINDEIQKLIDANL